MVSWKQCLSDNQAWDTLTWFAALIAMAAYLNKYGFISWFSDKVHQQLLPCCAWLHEHGLQPEVRHIFSCVLELCSPSPLSGGELCSNWPAARSDCLVICHKRLDAPLCLKVVGIVGGLGLSWQATFGIILTLYFYSHYFFASGGWKQLAQGGTVSVADLIFRRAAQDGIELSCAWLDPPALMAPHIFCSASF